MKEIRNIFIGAKVTPSQKEYIKESADKCGMSVSDYLLSIELVKSGKDVDGFEKASK